MAAEICRTFDMGEIPAKSAKELFETVYDRLKLIANRQLQGKLRNTLNTTALVHELFLRMQNDRNAAFKEPGQFFKYAAMAMRHLLIDQARLRLRQKALAESLRQTITSGDHLEFVVQSAEEAMALEQALQQLEEVDARAARVLELRYFVGLKAMQIAEVLDVTRRTVDRDWRFACAYLKNLLP